MNEYPALIPNVDWTGKEQSMMLAAAQRDPSLVQAFLDEHSLYYTENQWELMMDQKRVALDMSGYAREEIYNFEILHGYWFQARHEVGDENVAFYNNRPWTAEDEAIIIGSGRKPYRFNPSKRYIDRVLGEQVAQRTAWRAVPKNAPSAPKVDAMNHVLAYVQQAHENQWDLTSSDIYRDGVVNGIGVGGVMLDMNNPTAAIRLTRELPKSFMWDINSARNGTLQDSKYIWKGTFEDRVMLAYQFPEWKQEILTGMGRIITATGFEPMYNMLRPKVNPQAGYKNFTIEFNPAVRRLYGALLFKREFYRRRVIEKWAVTDLFTGIQRYYDNQSDAWEACQLLQRGYLMRPDVLQAYGLNKPFIRPPQKVNVKVVDQMIFIGDQLIRCTTSFIDRIPYKFFIPQFYDGEVTSYFEQAKDDVRLLNRYMMALDQIFMGVKGVTAVNKAYFPNVMSDEELKAMVAEPNAVIVVDGTKNENWDMRRAITQFSPAQLSQLPMAIMGVIKDNFEMSYGGQSTVGSRDFAGQSGKSVENLSQQSSMSTVMLSDKYRIFNKDMGKDVPYLAQFLDPAINMRVMDESGTAYFASLNAMGIASPTQLEYDIEVDEVLASPSVREARLNRLAFVLGQVPDLAQDAIEPILEDADLDYDQKQKILKARDARLQAASQMEDREMALKENEMRVNAQVKLMNAAQKEREMDFVEQNKPKVSVSGKFSMDPLTEASVFNWAGLPANPAMGIIGKAMETNMELARLAAIQTQYNELQPKEVKQAIQQKAAASAMNASQGVPTPKDSGQRTERNKS